MESNGKPTEGGGSSRDQLRALQGRFSDFDKVALQFHYMCAEEKCFFGKKHVYGTGFNISWFHPCTFTIFANRRGTELYSIVLPLSMKAISWPPSALPFLHTVIILDQWMYHRQTPFIWQDATRCLSGCTFAEAISENNSVARDQRLLRSKAANLGFLTQRLSGSSGVNINKLHRQYVYIHHIAYTKPFGVLGHGHW